MLLHRRVLALASLIAVQIGVARGTELTAFSLREAAQQVSAGRQDAGCSQIAGITRLAALVVDRDSGDVIFVGQADPRLPGASLDDLAVAIRSVLLYNTLPLVSIDRTMDTEQTGQQKIRYEGGIEKTQFGRDFLDADVILKRLALGVGADSSFGGPSYFSLRMTAMASPASPKRPISQTVQSRFWFVADDPPLLGFDRDIVAIRHIQITVKTEVMSATANGKPAHELKDVRDIAGDNFATGITEHLDDLSAKHRPIARVKILFDLVSLFCGLKQSGDSPNLDFWLREYKITEVDTPVTYELLERKESRAVGGGLSLRLEVDGGISLRAVVRRLRAGSAETLRDVVLKTRPKADTLAWTIAVPGWQIPGDVEDADQPLPADLPDKQLGTSILARSAIYANEWNPADRESYWPVVTPQPLASSKPRVELTPGLPWRASPGQIGGVMLCNTARVQGLANPDRVAATIDPASGSFALIVSGQKVKVAQTDLRKFITALWAVYFGSEDPGISIDPISAESDHQLVRIIGQIADTDLARVLLDADYYMKQCAVGAQRPAVSGFRNVDELTGKKGLRHLGASRRFWFVPEAMSFRLCGGALVFEGGRMTLKTEYVFLRDKRAQAEPADQEFAAFWTKHYWDFAAVNPVYEELYDYARYVALAKYLKQSGANLQWFLLANRHLVLEKETPGAVPTLRAPSRVLKGARWIGGVDLAVDMSPTQPGRYHLDATATVAIRQALARRTAGGVPATAPTSRETSFSRLGNEPLTARLADGAYTIAPAVSLAGSSMGGSTVFHTDLAARSKGEPGIELIRYNKAGGGDGLFGRNWDLYLPYGLAAANGSGKIKAADVPILAADDKVVKASLYVPEKFVVTDRLDGSTETLVFNKEHFDTVAWVPMDSKSSRFRGMTALNDGSFLLAEKSGCRFRFDQAGRLTDIVFSPDHRTSFTYSGDHLASVSDGFGGNVELTYQNNRIARAASGDQFAEYRYLDDDLAFVRYSDGRKLAFIYRPDGSLEEVVAGADRTPRETKPGS